MSIQSVLKSKNAEIDRLINQFRTVYAKIHPQIFREVQAQFKKGVFNEQIIANVFDDLGFTHLYQSFVDEFGSIVKFGRELSTELGIGFNLSNKSKGLLDVAMLQVENNFAASTAKFANDLTLLVPLECWVTPIE